MSKTALKYAFIMFNILLFISFLSAWHIFRGSTSFAKEHLSEYFLTIVKIAAHLTDGQSHQTLTTPEQKDSAAYHSIQKAYRGILQNSKDVKYLYSVTVVDNKIHFVVDSDYSDVAEIMELYDITSPEILDTFYNAKPNVAREPYTDKWGTFISAYAPIFNDQKQVVAVVIADLEISDYIESMDAVRKPFYFSIIIAGAFAIIFSGMTYVANRKAK